MPWVRQKFRVLSEIYCIFSKTCWFLALSRDQNCTTYYMCNFSNQLLQLLPKIVFIPKELVALKLDYSSFKYDNRPKNTCLKLVLEQVKNPNSHRLYFKNYSKLEPKIDTIVTSLCLLKHLKISKHKTSPHKTCSKNAKMTHFGFISELVKIPSFHKLYLTKSQWTKTWNLYHKCLDMSL